MAFDYALDLLITLTKEVMSFNHVDFLVGLSAGLDRKLLSKFPGNLEVGRALAQNRPH